MLRAPRLRLLADAGQVEAVDTFTDPEPARAPGDEKTAARSIGTTAASTDYPGALWVPSPHYSSRAGTPVTHVALHTVEGSYASCVAWFCNSQSSVGAHYVLRSADGQVTQMVREADKAWHLGSENRYTLGIEHGQAPAGEEGEAAGEFPPFRKGDGWYVTAQALLDGQGQVVADDVRGFNALLTASECSGSGVVEVELFCSVGKNGRTGAYELPGFEPGGTYRLEMILLGILDGPVMEPVLSGPGEGEPVPAPNGEGEPPPEVAPAGG